MLNRFRFAYNNLGICLLFRGELDRITTILDLLNFKSLEMDVVMHRRRKYNIR